jgi:hypothetical protein
MHSFKEHNLIFGFYSSSSEIASATLPFPRFENNFTAASMVLTLLSNVSNIRKSSACISMLSFFTCGDEESLQSSDFDGKKLVVHSTKRDSRRCHWTKYLAMHPLEHLHADVGDTRNIGDVRYGCMFAIFTAPFRIKRNNFTTAKPFVRDLRTRNFLTHFVQFSHQMP